VQGRERGAGLRRRGNRGRRAAVGLVFDIWEWPRIVEPEGRCRIFWGVAYYIC
jgi:hypothetical protein